MLSLQDRFDTVSRVVNRFDHDGLRTLGVTPFLPTPHQEVFDALQFLTGNYISQSDTFVDLGCGIGTVTAISAYVFQIPTIGIELDRQLFETAKTIMTELDHTFNRGVLNYIHGDFTNIELYKNHRTDVVFNFLGGDISPVLRMVSSGTYFLTYLYGGKSVGIPTTREAARTMIFKNPNFQQLNRDTRQKMLTELIDTFHNWQFICQVPLTKMYLYQKQ